jgi:hypothetical protein
MSVIFNCGHYHEFTKGRLRVATSHLRQLLIGSNQEFNAPSGIYSVRSFIYYLRWVPCVRFSGLARPPLALQHLFLRNVAHRLGLLVSHLNDSIPVTLGDTESNLLASGLNFF